MRKIRHKKLIASGIAVTLAGVLGAGALLQSSVSVQASPAMMPGIEQIVNDTTAEKPFKILEIVDNTNEAEIGYYVSGQEPYVKLYKYTYTDKTTNEEKTKQFSTLKEGLEKLPTETLRKEFATNMKTAKDGTLSDTGIKNIQSSSYQAGSADSEENYPLSYSEYQEKYFLSDSDNPEKWQKINFQKIDDSGNSRTDTVKIKGNYRENTAGTGDYTKQEQKYYPIRQDTNDGTNSNDKYRENIQNFYYADNDGANAPYFLEFSEVSNDTVNAALQNSADQGQTTILPEYNYENGKYGYYENVYSDLTTEIANNIFNKNYTFPGENPVITGETGRLIQDNTSVENAFSSGGEEFTDLDGENGSEQQEIVGNVTEQNQADISSVEPQANSGTADVGFSDGEFSSEELDSGENNESLTGNENQNITSASENAADNEAAKSEDNKETGGNGQPLIEYTPLKTEDNKAIACNTQEDPLVYYGTTIDKYPFYQYKLISNLNTIKTKAIDVDTNADADFELEAALDNSKISINNNTQYCNITIQEGQYWFWLWNANENVNNAVRYPISIVTQRQPVAYSDIRQIPDNLGYNYYYKVDKVYFCCKKDNSTTAEDAHAYKYYGWYSASYADENTPYISENDINKATHYISDAEYKLTPGTGNYDFVPDDTASEQTVEVDHMYYQGGYTNHDWFKQYVFHLDPNDPETKDQFNSFDIKVDVVTTEVFNNKYGNKTATITDTTNNMAEDDSTYVNSGMFQDSGEMQTEEFQDNESEMSEVAPMVSEAGVELVSIENEINDNGTITDEFQDGIESSANDVSTFSAEEADITAEDSELEKYDLIYVNGKLWEQSANVIVSSEIPCIVNSIKADQTETLKTAFELFYNASDKDRHYVNRYFYFFKNTYTESENLLNANFHKNFNEKLDEITDENNSDTIEGFEEILEYIESENQYRQIGDLFSDNGTSDSLQSDDKLLKKNLSQARAIEYIINYKYKRKLNTKSEINVLEIEPAKVSDTDKLGKDTVRNWLNTDINRPIIDKVIADCEQTNQNNAATNQNNAAMNIKNSDKNLIWHSAWNSSGKKYHNTGNHTLTITLKNPANVSGFYYTPRQDGNMNGKVRYFKISLIDKNRKTQLQNETNTEALCTNQNDRDVKRYTFKEEKTYKNIKTIKIEITESYDDTESKSKTNISNKFASCAYLEFFNNEESKIDPVVTTMTASEYVGHIDDINSKYDMIYIGDKIGKVRNELINGKDPMLYTHVGAAVKADSSDNDNSKKLRSLLGMLDIDYVGISPNKYMRDTQLYNTGEDSTKEYPGLGSFRGSGNDMTNQQYLELMDFVKSGYPVVIADSLVSDGHASTRTVDNSSYYYKFIEDALSYNNVTTVSELQKTDLSFFVKLSKPVIEFTENGRPAEVPRIDEANLTDTSGYLEGEDLRYEFTIKNDSDAYPVNSTYNCELFFDLNFDGNLSKLEEQSKYIEIQDESGNVLSKTDGVYHLQLGKKYLLRRKIPDDYFKVITWKLQITNNNNNSIRTSVIGYSKRQGNTKQTINVLQIMPKKEGNADLNLSTWNLQSELSNPNSTFNSLMSNVQDFQLNIETVDVDEYSERYKEYVAYKNDQTGTIASAVDPLANKQMIILGFGDVYKNISNASGEVDAIKQFIKDGRSVIFTHDTTSSINWDYREFKDGATNPRTEDNKSIKDEYLWKTVNRKDWGYSLNTLFRNISGLDRYGITNTESTSKKDGDITISELLKKGRILNASDPNVDFDYMQKMSGDVAYKTNSNRLVSYMQTQGYTNNQLKNTTPMVNTATKVNDGAITQYPYSIANTLSVATTHGQYYQLALEKDMDINGVSDEKNDIVVWYCLGEKVYAESPNDVRNNYYFYSRGNVIYTGVGHNTVTNEEEIKLFINAIVAAANVTAVKPEVNFVTELSPAAQVEKIRYYVTDQTSWNEKETNLLQNEQDFFINVRDYNMVSSSLSLEDKSKEEMTVDFYIGGTEETNKINQEITQMISYGDNPKQINLSEDGSFHVENNAYRITLPQIEKYLRDTNGKYLQNCKLYVKVTSKVALYGKSTVSVSEASIDLKQRQLFELD